ncbi:alpha/beta hydrolase [Sphingomonas sp. HF-S4]|uniref:Alpha/beta hydrolase n=1 Tax=Sphingomonas agrestis TaxID=3080540 RepID=A0ABU3Y968_9SPHN|nr:alpha/beta hydrolase [Sphingomonas sp. HF-S4]MDV3457944.1 alpha/beta hydrolase [Sphingomonas sp. HF-S4]
MKSLILAAALAATFTSTGSARDMPDERKPTIVLVHGAFADSSSWNGVVSILRERGYAVTAAANPLRGVSSDAKYVDTVIQSIDGPVVLVGHSYGGAVISAADNRAGKIKALVFVAAFEPEVGENSLDLTSKFPGSTLSAALAAPVSLPGGAHDLYIKQDRFPEQFAADVPKAQAAQMAVAQRPIADAALSEKSQVAAWKNIPSWAVYGTADRNIPPAAMEFMAQRAKSKAVVVDGASHVLMISHPDKVADVIVQAAGG